MKLGTPKFTGSLKVKLTTPASGTLIAPLPGLLVLTLGAVSTLKLRTVSAIGLFGGSMASTSAICAATAVAVQLLPSGSGALGVKVSVAVPDPLMAPAIGAPQFRVIAPPRLLTGSSKLKLKI